MGFVFAVLHLHAIRKLLEAVLLLLLRVDDGATDSVDVTITLTGTNDAPVINEITSTLTGGLTENLDTDLVTAGTQIDSSNAPARPTFRKPIGAKTQPGRP